MTKPVARILLFCTLTLAAAGPLAAQTSPTVVTKWRMNGEAQNICLGHADEALRRNGFKPLEPGSQSMMGTRGPYTAQIRCVPEQQIVFFVMSGPEPGVASQLLDNVFRGWGP